MAVVNVVARGQTTVRMRYLPGLVGATGDVTPEALAAQAAAEGAADLARDAASDAVAQGNVPIYSSRNAIEAMNIPVGITQFQVNGWAAAGDSPPAYYKFEASEPAHDGKVKSLNNRWFGLVPSANIFADHFGAIVGASAATTKASFIKAAAYCLAFGVEMRMAGRAYNIGVSSGLDLSGVTINPEPGASLQGDYDLPKKGYKLARPLTFQRTETGQTFLPNTQPTKYRRPIGDKEVFYSENDADREKTFSLDGTSMTLQEFVFASPSGWANLTNAATVSADAVAFQLASDRYQAALFAGQGGDEMHTIFQFGDFTRAAIIRTVNGFYHLSMTGFNGSGSAGALYWQPYGGSPELVTTVDWQGRTDVEHWYPGYAAWSVVKFSPVEFGFRINGMLLFGSSFSVKAGDLIADIGFAVKGSGATVGIAWTTLQRGAKVTGRGYVNILTAGDSRTAPNFACWPDLLKEKLEGALGTSVLSLKNLAVDGWTTQTTYETVIANGFSGITHLVLACGSNDAQAAISLATTRTYYLAIIDAAQAAGVRVVCVLFPDWYSAALAGQGSVTYNNALAPQYRMMIRKLAAMRGCAIVDMSQEMKPVLPYEAQNSPAVAAFKGTYDTGFIDNIHNGGHINNLTADAGTRRILGILPRRRRGFDEINLPSGMLDSGWATSSISARIFMSEDGRVHFAGRLSPGTKTGGWVTRIIAFPYSFRPYQRRSFKLFTLNNAFVRVDADPDGLYLVDSFGDGDGELILDGVSYQAA